MKTAIKWLRSVRVQLPFMGWGRFGFERFDGRHDGETFWILDLGALAVSRNTLPAQTVGERGAW